MAFVDRLRARVTKVRALADAFGVRQYTVAVRVNTWSGDERGDGNQVSTLTTDTVAVTEAGGKPPKVRWLSTEQRAVYGAAGVGGFASELVEVGPITPGNTLRSALQPSTSGNDTVEWILTGPKYPDGARFSLKEIRDDRGYQFKVVLEKVAD